PRALLVQAKWVHLTGKKILGVESVGVTNPERAAVQVVATALQPDIDYRAAAYSVLHAGIRLHIEFGYAFQWDQSRCRARNSRLTGRRFAVVAVVVGNAVHRKIVGSGALAVDIKTLKTAPR